MRGPACKRVPLADPAGPVDQARNAAPARRLVEESDLRAAQELFGGGAASGSKLDAMLPKTVKDFEEYSALLVSRWAGA